MSNIYQAGGDYGRSVAPQFVEDVLRSVKPVLQENGNLSYKSGTVEIITNLQGSVCDYYDLQIREKSQLWIV